MPDAAPQAPDNTAYLANAIALLKAIDARSQKEYEGKDPASIIDRKIYNTFILGQRKASDSFKSNMRDALEDNLGNKSKLYKAIEEQKLDPQEEKKRKDVVDKLSKEILGKKILQGMGKALSAVSGAIQNLGNIFMPMIFKAIGLVLAMAIFDPQGTLLRSLLGIVMNLAMTLLNIIVKQLPWVIKNIITVLTETLPNLLKDLFGTILPMLSEMFINLGTSLLGDPKTKGIGEFLKTVGEMLGSPKLLSALNTLADNLPELIIAMIGVSILGKVLTFFTPIAMALLQFGKFILPALKITKGFIGKIFGKALGNKVINGLLTVAKEWVGKIFGWIAKKGIGAIPIIGWIILALGILSNADFIMNIFDWITKKADDFIKWAFDAIEGQLDGILSIFKPVVYNIRFLLNLAMHALKNNPITLALNMFRVGGMRKMIPAFIKSVISVVKSFPPFRIIKDIIQNIGQAMKGGSGLWGAILRSLKEVFDKILDTIKNWAKDLLSSLGYNIKTMTYYIAEVFSHLKEIVVGKYNMSQIEGNVNKRLIEEFLTQLEVTTGKLQSKGKIINQYGNIDKKDLMERLLSYGESGEHRPAIDSLLAKGISRPKGQEGEGGDLKTMNEVLNALGGELIKAKANNDIARVEAINGLIRSLDKANDSTKSVEDRQLAFIEALQKLGYNVKEIVKNTRPKTDVPTFDLSGLRLRYDF